MALSASSLLKHEKLTKDIILAKLEKDLPNCEREAFLKNLLISHQAANLLAAQMQWIEKLLIQQLEINKLEAIVAAEIEYIRLLSEDGKSIFNSVAPRIEIHFDSPNLLDESKKVLDETHFGEQRKWQKSLAESHNTLVTLAVEYTQSHTRLYTTLVLLQPLLEQMQATRPTFPISPSC